MQFSSLERLAKLLEHGFRLSTSCVGAAAGVGVGAGIVASLHGGIILFFECEWPTCPSLRVIKGHIQIIKPSIFKKLHRNRILLFLSLVLYVVLEGSWAQLNIFM